MVMKVKYEVYAKEIKNRFGYIVLSFLLAFSVSYYKATQLIYLFVLSCNTWNPLDPKISFIFTDVREAFSATLVVCMVFSVFSVSLFVLYSFVCFFLPSWFVHERTSKVVSVCLLCVLWVYYILWVDLFIIPKVCDFFFAFQVQNIDCFSVTVETRIYSYVLWGVNSLILASFVFILVCVLLFCQIKGKIDITKKSKNRKARVFACILLAALVSPPELLTQCVVCLFLLLLFEAILLFAFLYNKFTTRICVSISCSNK